MDLKNREPIPRPIVDAIRRPTLNVKMISITQKARHEINPNRLASTSL